MAPELHETLVGLVGRAERHRPGIIRARADYDARP